MEMIIFTVDSKPYALALESVERIIEPVALTPIPGCSSEVDGMISYDNRVVKVLNFRKMIGIESYEAYLKRLFPRLIAWHTKWLQALRDAVEKREPFTMHSALKKCPLGVWLASFHAYDETLNMLIAQLQTHHNPLHRRAAEVLKMAEESVSEAVEVLHSEIIPLHKKVEQSVEALSLQIEKLSLATQKYIIVKHNGRYAGVKVDTIVNIEDIDLNMLDSDQDSRDVGDFLHYNGMFKLNSKLVSYVSLTAIPA